MKKAKKLLVVQFRTDSSLEHEKRCIKRITKLKKSQIEFFNVFDKKSSYKKLLEKIKEEKNPLIVAGSGQFYIIKQNDTKSIQKKVDLMKEKVCEMLEYILEHPRPTLGLCFGHQLLAYCYGAKVIDDPKYAETGIYEVKLNKKGENSPLFEGMPSKFNSVIGHKDSVVEIPKNATLLASSKRCKVQALDYGNSIYTVQFHPELDMQGLKERLALYPSYKSSTEGEEEQQDVIGEVSTILKNFIKIAGL